MEASWPGVAHCHRDSVVTEVRRAWEKSRLTSQPRPTHQGQPLARGQASFAAAGSRLACHDCSQGSVLVSDLASASCFSLCFLSPGFLHSLAHPQPFLITWLELVNPRGANRDEGCIENGIKLFQEPFRAITPYSCSILGGVWSPGDSVVTLCRIFWGFPSLGNSKQTRSQF